MVDIKIVDAEGNEVANTYKTKFAAGFDLAVQESLTLLRGRKPKVVGTGLYLKVEGKPEGADIPALLLLPRSSMAAEGITLANSPALIDLDYEGEIKLILTNVASSKTAYRLNAGDRVAQGVFITIFRPEGIKKEDANRGDGGLGSTGKNDKESKKGKGGKK